MRQIHNAPERQYFQAIAHKGRVIFSGNCSHKKSNIFRQLLTQEDQYFKAIAHTKKSNIFRQLLTQWRAIFSGNCSHNEEQYFQAIAHTMKSSYKELSLLLLFVGMGMLIFGRYGGRWSIFSFLPMKDVWPLKGL